MNDLSIFRDKRVIVTGHTGFKGSWLSLWLKMLGADVYGIALEPEGEVSLYNALNLDDKINSTILDIGSSEELVHLFEKIKPDAVFHLAAQSLVGVSYDDPVGTYATNVMGTVNILEALRGVSSVKAFLNVTTDKCYENINQGIPFKESDPMGGFDPYSSSKACSEIVTQAYRKSFFSKDCNTLVATARAGNVIGGGDFSKDRLLPDCIRALSNGKAVKIRNPDYIRPWQFVLEPLRGYIMIVEKLLQDDKSFADSFNFGPANEGCKPVVDIVQGVIDRWGEGSTECPNRGQGFYEASVLRLDTAKAEESLKWRPLTNIDSGLDFTVSWYREFYSGRKDIYEYSINQINEYMGFLK